MFEGTVAKSLRCGKVSKIHEIFMVGYLSVGKPEKKFQEKISPDLEE